MLTYHGFKVGVKKKQLSLYHISQHKTHLQSRVTLMTTDRRSSIDKRAILILKTCLMLHH